MYAPGKRIAVLLLAIAAVFSSCKKEEDEFSLLSPAKYSTSLTGNETFTCTQVKNAAFYHFHFSEINSIEIVVTSATNSATTNQLQPGLTYSWYVVAERNDGSTITTPSWSFTMGGSSGPTLVSPADGAIVAPRPRLVWTPVGSASDYWVTIASDPNMYVVEHQNIAYTTSYDVPAGLPSNATYYWRVSAGGSTTQISSIFSFSIAGAPTLLTPANGAVNVAKPVVFTFSAVPGATSYTGHLSFYSDFSSIVEHRTVSTNSYTMGALPNKKYYWRVKVTGSSTYSSTFSFTTD